jgi:hypothetical protein
MRFRNLFAASLLAISLGAGATSLRAQGIVTGTVSGTVQDSTGAVIPGAVVTATNKSQNLTFNAKSNASGDFNFSSLPVGTYSVTVKMAGFGDLNIGNVLVETGKTTGLGVEKLQTGSAVETVEVSTARNLLETTQAQVTTTFDSEAIEDLPTGGGLDQLALLVPGVVGTRSANFSNTNGTGISSNGQRGRSNNFEIDGQANNDNSVAGSQIFFQNQDALAEVQVITNNFGAQYGRNMGSVVNYITKSGTNAIHGSLFEFFTGDFLSAYTNSQKSTLGSTFNNCQAGLSPPPAGTPYTVGDLRFNFTASGAPIACGQKQRLTRFTDNTFGGTLGFPILKDKLFAFGSTLWTRDLNGSTSSTSGTRVFPTTAGLAQLQAALPGNAGVAELANFGPYAAVGGVVTQSPLSTTTSVTLPNGAVIQVPFAQITRTYNPQYFDQEHLGRLDYQMTPKDRFFLRYFYQNNISLFGGGSFASGAYYNVGDIAHSVGADWTHTFGPRWVNQLRYSFQQTKLDFDGGGFPKCTISNLSQCPSTFTLGAPYLSLGLANNIPQGRVVKVTQIIDNVTYNLGRHSITFGGEFDYQNSPNVFLPYINGGFSVTSFNNLLANITSSLTLATGASPNIHFTEPDFAGYVQDDWKVTPSFTANLGLRYEFFGQSLNLLHDSSLKSQNSSTPQWSTSLVQTGTATQAPTVFPFTPSFKKGFEPRIGFAYNPAAMKKLVIRGGFAINFDPAYYNIALNSYSAAPIVNQSTFTGCNGTTAQLSCIPAGGAYNTAVHAQDDVNNPSGGNPGAKTQTRVTPNFHNPYAESYTFGVQYEALKAATVEVRYSGNHTIGNFQTFNGNPTVGPNAGTTINGVTYAGATGGVGSFNAGYGGTALIPALANYFPAAAGNYCLPTQSTLNTAGSPTQTTADVGRSTCGSTLVRVRANTAFSIYNALQTSIQTRNFYGFTGSANWTWGKVVDNSSEVFSTNGGGNTNAFAQNPFNINTAERGVAATNFKNITSVGMVYTLPFFKHSTSLVGKTIGGFQVNSLYTFSSGQPFTPSQYYYSTLGANYSPNKSVPVQYGKDVFSTCDFNFNNGFTSLDVCRPFQGNPNAAKGTVALNVGGGNYVDANNNPISRNAARYVINNVNEELVQGTPFGTVGRNTATANTYNNVNFGLFKSFHITERYNVQLQTTLFNALNRAYYGTPDVLIDDASNGNGATFNNFTGNGGGVFGPSTGSATGSRNIQLGLKIQY